MRGTKKNNIKKVYLFQKSNSNIKLSINATLYV